MSDKKVELDPLCFKDQIGMAVTNQGYLIPCCRCDDPENMADKSFQDLLAVSKISKTNTVEDILQSKEWSDFQENLKNNIGPPSCVNTCYKNKKEDDMQIIKKINGDHEQTVQRR